MADNKTAPNRSAARKVLAVIPARNEEENIEETIRGLRRESPDVEILVVSDASTDRTAELAGAAGAHVVRLPCRLGYGGALQTGFKYAVTHGYDYLLQMDADGQHDPASAAALLEPVLRGEADVTIGSRFRGRLEYRIPALRRLGMSFFSLIVRLATRRHFTDPTSGYQAMNRNVVRFFAQGAYASDFPDADTIIWLSLSGFEVREVPVRMLPRTRGESMHSNLRAGYYVAKMLLSIMMVILRALPERHKRPLEPTARISGDRARPLPDASDGEGA